MTSLKPPFRKLRGYAFDPSLSLKMETAVINELVYKVDWEELEKGPIGEYVEVVDYDPSSGIIYIPVNLNDKYILAMDGISPSDGNPQFHQQMAYAVCMTTIKNFEMALGRKAIWSPRIIRAKNGQYSESYVKRLRIYPHALREANAYYSPQKKAVLFGYFSAAPQDISLHMPGGIVFNCLSHDIIAHETSHALLDGMHTRFTIPTNPDVLAFHEAFSDIVALFQHFTFSDVLKHQIAKTKGNLESQNLLGQMAQEFGKAIGHYGSLRDAIGEIDPHTKNWKPKEADPLEYERSTEPHDRGSILVAAVFDAFLNIYKGRIADLLRIASGGTGKLPEGEIHPDLVNRLAIEASKTASHVLRMCVRALDYCPTTDITFGDYLRAIITADANLIDNDTRNYRLAFIDAFRKRGIYPKGIKTLSVDSLVYQAENYATLVGGFSILGKFLREFREAIYYETNREKIFNITRSFIAGSDLNQPRIVGLHERINNKFDGSNEFERLTGLVFTDGWEKLGIRDSDVPGVFAPSFEVSSLKVANPVGPEGKIINHIVLTLEQRCGVICKPCPSNKIDFSFTTYVPGKETKSPEGGFEFRGSCTLIFDLDTLKIKHVISKPLIDCDLLKKDPQKTLNKQRIFDQYQFMFEGSGRTQFASYFNDSFNNFSNEPFAFLHRS